MTTRTPADLVARAASWNGLDRNDRRQLARGLRVTGLSYGEIGRLIPVAKSTLSAWVHDISLSVAQRDAIEQRRKQKDNHRDTQWRRRLEIEQIREQAATFAVSHLDDPFFVAGVCLYWGEGAKTTNQCSITNSDPTLLRLFIAWVRAYLDPDAEVVLALHLHEINDEREARQYWSAATGLDAARFTRTYIKPKGTGHRKNRLRYGICRVRVLRPADHWNRIMVWIDVISKHFDSGAGEVGIIPPGR
jgi:hypothetical protein